MKKILKRIKLASLITIIIAIFLSITLTAVQILNHNLQKEIASEGQKALSDGILSSLQFSITSNNSALIEEQVIHFLKNKAIYALEVSDSDGKILYRKENEKDKSITINTQKYNVYLPFDSIEIDEFSEEKDHSQELVGFIKIYFSTEHIDRKIRNNFICISVITKGLCRSNYRATLS